MVFQETNQIKKDTSETVNLFASCQIACHDLSMSCLNILNQQNSTDEQSQLARASSTSGM